MVLLDHNLLALAVKSEIVLLDSETLNEIRRVKYHEHYILSVIKLENNYLASSSADEIINIFDLQTNELVFSLNQTGEAFTCLATLENNLLASGSTNSIRVWDLNKGKLKTTISYCASLLIVFSKKYLISSCDDFQSDYSIKIFDLNFETTIKILSEHTESILSLILVNENFLISGSSDSTIKIWNLSAQNNSLRTLYDINKNVEALAVLENFLVAGNSIGEIHIWRVFK